jgi:hypothetical protein
VVLTLPVFSASGFCMHDSLKLVKDVQKASVIGREPKTGDNEEFLQEKCLQKCCVRTTPCVPQRDSA